MDRLRDSYGVRRRLTLAEILQKIFGKITRDEGDIDLLDLIDDDQLVITMTRSGYIKSTPLEF